MKNLKLFETDVDNVLARFLTMDECWVHHLQLERKQQSKQWKRALSPTPKKTNVTPSDGNVMVAAFGIPEVW